MFNNLAEWLEEAADGPLWRPVLANEKALQSLTEEAIFAQLGERLQIMRDAAQGALDAPLSMPGGLLTGISSRQQGYAQEEGSICGPMINRLMARALSCSEVNASMGRICAAPTAGACGVLPAVLLSVSERFSSSERQMLEALLIASGVGGIVMQNATVSGAEGGCQAECGVAAAMGAAAAVYLAGGGGEASLHGAALALIHCMGLVCDPIAGLVQVPCAQRNASQAVNALLSADLALAGMRSVIPPDEVVDAMLKTGRMLPPQLRETAMGGLAATPTGKRIAKELSKE